MKKKKNSEYFNGTLYKSIYSKSTKGFTSYKGSIKKNNKRNKNTLKINSEEKESKGFPVIFTSNSFNNPANLYLNKTNYIWKKKKNKENKYYEKEQLFDRVLKLQTALNILNKKYKIQKIENTKQSKEIKKQNNFLNLININNFHKKRSFSKPNLITSYRNKRNKTISFEEKEFFLNKGENNYFSNNNIDIKEKYKIPENISKEQLKKKYMNLVYELEHITKKMNYLENENLKKDYENIKISNETLISNLKLKIKNLLNENELKNNEIINIKKTMKYSNFNEMTKERDIFEKEMIKMKSKLKDLLKKVYHYKEQEQEINK